MAETVAIGVQDFSKIIENNYFYVDKTIFIKEWWENGDDITLITRPRRFGKTLTMSMLEHFFSVRHAGRSDLFKNLKIWKEKEYRQRQGTYPVIFLSFANVKGNDFQAIRKLICQQIINLYEDHRYVLDSGFLKDGSAAYFKRIAIDMDNSDFTLSLGQLSRYLSMYYHKKVIILLDEYDTPMQEAYINGYQDKIAELMRGLFHAAFKTNPYLERGLMTGTTRVSKESVFSDLNNLAVVTTATPMYATTFGFTEEEVFQALKTYGLQDQADEVKRWYDGFRFGDCDHIYNPWSMINYLKYKKFAAYWANTSSNAFVGKLIQKSDCEIKIIVEDLLQGKSFRAIIDEQVVFDQLEKNPDAVWGFLLASGYLKIADFHNTGDYFGEELIEYELTLTNLEIISVFRKTIHGWFVKYKTSYNDFIKAMLINNTEAMNVFMNKVTAYTISSFDAGKGPSAEAEPERFYHGFVLGLMVDLYDRYHITSNRESGFGRYDVLLEPKNDTDDGIILEFKVIYPKKERSLADTVQAAIRQIVDKKYAAALEPKCGRDRIRIYGFAFRGKEVWIDGGYLRAFHADGQNI